MSGHDVFELVTDGSGRIKHFVAAGFDGAPVPPEQMFEYLRGEDSIVYGDQEYVLTIDGSLVHVDVALPPPEVVELGKGVILGAGVDFEADEVSGEEDRIVIGDRAKILGSTLHAGVQVGAKDVIVGSELGPGTTAGEQVRLREGVVTGEDVSLANCVKVDTGSELDNGVQVDYAAVLGYNTVVGAGTVIGKNCQIGKPMGDPTVKPGDEGIVIEEGLEIPEKSLILPDPDAEFVAAGA